ncbi:MAG: class I SAM-dependent methyltransferase [Thermomicrobium sp.]|nr:class I SAM-dependent methyltransferase [Thermomicrobium sp.]
MMPKWPTTERVAPESWALRVTYWQSLAAYRWASDHVRGKRVLDVGCGDGYGTAELAARARYAVGLDDDGNVLREARRRYGAPRLAWVRARADRLPFRDESLDVVCCFQVLEHLREPERFLAEARRVLVPEGILLMTTPNRSAVLAGLNPHHVREYDAEGLRRLCSPFFQDVELLGVFPSERVARYRAANRRLVERLLRWDRFGLVRRLPVELRASLHAIGTLAVRRWVNARQRRLVEAIGVDDFTIGPGDLARAIDLVVVATRR